MRVGSERDGDRVTVRVGGATDDATDDAAGIRVLGTTPVRADGDVGLIAGLLPAMRHGRDLCLDDEVSAGLLAGVEHIQEVFCTWDRFLRPVDRWYSPVTIDAPVRHGAPPPATATACLFTGGADSFHAVITERHRIDALVYVHGFDVALDDDALRTTVSTRLRAAAAELGLELVEVESELQTFGERWGVPWDDYHGAALAAVGVVLSERFGRLLVPATHTWAHLEGLGSHPLLDPWWSGDRLVVEHVGAGATRVDKIRLLDTEPTARRHLRVCWENRAGRYNCGECEKCVRTGVAVRLAGAEGRFATIPSPSLREVATVEMTGRGTAWHELRNDLVASGAAPRLRHAIDVALARHQLRRWRFTKRFMR